MEADEKIVIETYEKMVCTRRKYQKLKQLACKNILKQMYGGKIKSLRSTYPDEFFTQFIIYSLMWYIIKWPRDSVLYVGLINETSTRRLISHKPEFVFACFLYFLIESCYAIKVGY